MGLGFSSDPLPRNAESGLNIHSGLKFTTPLPQFNFKAEFAVHRYWGLGIIGSTSEGKSYNYTNDHTTSTIFNADAGVFTNFHFYQLIADKTGQHKKMLSDKLDVYVGGGLFYRYQIENIPGIIVQKSNLIMPDFHMGVRYQITSMVGIYGELGVGQSIFNTGVIFKLGMPAKKKSPKAF